MVAARTLQAGWTLTTHAGLALVGGRRCVDVVNVFGLSAGQRSAQLAQRTLLGGGCGTYTASWLDINNARGLGAGGGRRCVDVVNAYRLGAGRRSARHAVCTLNGGDHGKHTLYAGLMLSTYTDWALGYFQA